jgi:hypothetical protein
LPSPPFPLHKPVILFCHHPTYCFEPLPVTPERLASIRDWLADAARSDDAAPFAQLQQGIKKANSLRASRVLIFEGEIVRIQPTGTGLCESLKRREDDIKIDHPLFGETEKGRIAASDGSVNCPIPLSVRLHAKVIVYGALQLPANQSCLPPVDATTENLATVNSWTTQPSSSGQPSRRPKTLRSAFVGSGNQRPENLPRSRIVLHRALRMPLHRHHEMIRRRAFHRFNDPVFGAPRHNPQPLANLIRGLMMGGIHRRNDRI